MLILIILFILKTQGKCPLWVVEDGVERMRDSCDDWEMFDRCKRAQEYLDIFTERNKYQKIDLICPLRCIGYTVPGRRLYCQQRDAVNMCIFVKKFNPTLNCYRSIPIALDGIKVIDYTQDRSPTGIIPDFNLTFTISNLSSRIFPLFFFLICLF